jgi:hypothetical protein
MIDALIKRVSVTFKCYEVYAHREKKCNCSCFEIDQEMDAILLIIGIVSGVCRIVIKSVQQCTYFLFSVNLLLVGVNYGQRTIQVCAVNKRQNTNYSFFPVTSKVSCIRRKRGQIIYLQGNNKSMVISVISVLKRRKVVR